MIRWSFWLFALAEFCMRCETKGTWRGVCSGVQGQSSWGGQGEPHGAVGFLALGWNWSHWRLKMLQDVPLGQAYSHVRHYGGGRYPQYFLIGFVQISWVVPEDSGGFKPPPSPWPRHCQRGNISASHFPVQHLLNADTCCLITELEIRIRITKSIVQGVSKK